MKNKVLEEFQAKKQMLVTLAQRANEFGWITNEQRQDITAKLNNEVLTIGVIGQMNCGKSTFLNAFVFGDDVLPTASSPMTAALSVIKYGESEKIVVEFYTVEDWEAQKNLASRSLDNLQGAEYIKVKSAQELVGYAKKLGDTIDSNLGTTKSDNIENLIEYVGKNGKYVSITKSVTIYSQKAYLKGVEIVDTPGFNDPILSREERTKEFLTKADVVLMMLYAGRAFDSTDRDILFEIVQNCGIGKILMAINKYDVEYGDEHNPMVPKQIVDYVKKMIDESCRNCNDISFAEMLRQTEPMLLSAEMALVSQLPMSKINNNKVYLEEWNKYHKLFDNVNQKLLRDKSFIDKLEDAIKRTIETEKTQILFAKPQKAIMAAGMAKKAKIEEELFKSRNLIADISKPDEELEEKQKNVTRAERRLSKKIDNLDSELGSTFKQLIRKSKEDLEDDVDDSVKKMKTIIEDKRWYKGYGRIDKKINEEAVTLLRRTLKRHVNSISDKAKKDMKGVVSDFVFEVDDICMKYVPDFQGRDFIKSLNNSIQFEIDEKLFRIDSDIEISMGEAIKLFIYKQFPEDLGNDRWKAVENMRGKFDPTFYLENIISSKEEVITRLRKAILTELISPMREQIEKILSNKKSREEQLRKAKEEEAKLLSQKSEIEQQMAEIEQQSDEIGQLLK